VCCIFYLNFPQSYGLKHLGTNRYYTLLIQDRGTKSEIPFWTPEAALVIWKMCNTLFLPCRGHATQLLQSKFF